MLPSTTERAGRLARSLLGGSRRSAAGRGTAALVAIAALSVVLATRGTPAPPHPLVSAVVNDVPTATAEPTPTPTPTPSPAPAPTAAPATTYTGGGGYTPPSYPLVGHLVAPAVGVHLPVVAVGIVHGAMDAPEGPLGSAFWREAFWLKQSAVPGNPGTATFAGHLDDTAGRPAAFWNIRNLKVGQEVIVTRQSDGAVLRFKIVETDVWSLATANRPANLARIYGSGPGDGVSRISLITCTGHWNGYEYDHRFVAFATLES